MQATPRVILVCQTDRGAEPFSEWLDTLDPKAQAIMLERVDRVERGNFGDCSSVGGGILELRIDFGPGYRIYFGQIGSEVHLINGGQKKRQRQDIEEAKKFWSEHA